MRKSKQKAVMLTEQAEQYLDKIREKQGLIGLSDTIRFSIAFTYGKLFPSYVDKKKPVNMSAADEVDRSEELRKAREEKKQAQLEDQGRQVCDALTGTVEEQGGEKQCTYRQYTFAGKKRPVQAMTFTVPLKDLREGTTSTQFVNGTKEEVLSAIEANGIEEL